MYIGAPAVQGRFFGVNAAFWNIIEQILIFIWLF